MSGTKVGKKRAPDQDAGKKVKKSKQQPVLSTSELESASEDDEEVGDGEFGGIMNGNETGSEGGGGEVEDDYEDSEINEFEIVDEEEEEGESEVEDDDEDDNLIEDDDEDLMAGLDEEDEENDSNQGESSASPAPPPVPPPQLKKANIRNSKAAAALTPAQLRALAFAEMTASPISNLIATEVTSLLESITPPNPSTSPLQPLLKELHAHFVALPSLKPKSLSEMKKKGVVVPSVEGLEDKWGALELGFEKPRPEDVRIVGKWAWGGGFKRKGEYCVDMAIAMPSNLLQPKDYLSPRFLIKSTHYLVTLSSQLPKSLGPVHLSYSALPGSQGYCLEIRSAYVKGSEKAGLAKTKGAVLRLRVVWPSSAAFPLARLGPLSNVARPPSATNQQIPSTDLSPTPLRSTSLLFSSLDLLTTHLKFHHTLAQTHTSYPSTVRLLQSWANLRSYQDSIGFSDEFWAWCVARTLNWGASSSGAVAAGGEAWAGWRKTLEWLAGVNWREGVFFRVEGDLAYSKEDFRKAFSGRPLFVDPTGRVNLAAGIDLATLEMLKQDAKTTISLLLAQIDDDVKFDGSFLREPQEAEKFDNFARITVPTSALLSLVSAGGPSDHCDPLSLLTSSISTNLQRALGTRIKAFQLNSPPPSRLAVQGHTSPTTSSVLTLGLLLDPAESGRLVDHGPSAEDEVACEEFRAFWGPKSELRRFKDGSISESVVWDATSEDGLGQRRSKVTAQVLHYILNFKHGIPSSHVEIFAGGFDHLVVEPFEIRRAIFLEDAVAADKGFGSVMGAFDDLAKELKDLPDLPLSIDAVQPSTPALRYTSIFIPSPRRLKDFERFPESTKYIEPLDIIITLEGSGRWPDDLEAVQKVKAAFLSKMAEGLSDSRTIAHAQVAIDLETRPVDDNVSLEILTATGFAFRARIYYERSLLLLRDRQAKLGVDPASTAETSLDVFNARFVRAPAHHAAISTLQHHFAGYSLTVRLVKRWFSSHMLSAHFPIELIELLAASVFVDPASTLETPANGATGFTRVMDKLANWKWRDEPLLVTFYSFSSATTSGRRPSFPTAAKSAARAAFELRRLSDPAIHEYAWVIATEEDVEGKAWGRGTGKVAAARARDLAQATLRMLCEGVRNGGLIVEQLFTPPLAGYSFLIHLDAANIPRHFQTLAPEAKALALRPRSSILSSVGVGLLEPSGEVRFGWDPVSIYVRFVQQLYPGLFLLFHSRDGAITIGGTWNPSMESPRPWKVGLGFPCKPVDGAEASSGKAKVVLDKGAVLAELERVGHGLVTRVETLN